MKPKRIESWEKIREKGAWRYGIIYGSIWGVFVVAFLVVINYFTKSQRSNFSLNNLLFMIVIYVVIGILMYRFLMWRVNEKNYHKWLEQEKNNNQDNT
jgi:high-affinity Fe2+/Pb2+ permease